MAITINRKLAGVAGAAALVAGIGSAVAATAPPATEPPAPPIAVDEFTRIDEDTLIRGAISDDVTATINVTHGGIEPITLQLADLSNVAVARFTVQPGAQFPWHSHAGPVLVTVVQGELVYVMSEDCTEHSYPAGTAFIDPGHGNVHSAYNPTDAETVLVATFLEMTAEGPLSITEGITGPADNCGMPAALADR